MLVGIFQWTNKVFPCGFTGISNALTYHLAALRKQFVHRRGDVFGFDVSKARQTGEIKQRIHLKKTFKAEVREYAEKTS